MKQKVSEIFIPHPKHDTAETQAVSLVNAARKLQEQGFPIKYAACQADTRGTETGYVVVLQTTDPKIPQALGKALNTTKTELNYVQAANLLAATSGIHMSDGSLVQETFDSGEARYTRALNSVIAQELGSSRFSIAASRIRGLANSCLG